MSDVLMQSLDDKGVAILTFNRPSVGNAWSAELHQDYLATLDDLAEDSAVRAVVVTGAGDSFCVGADVELAAGEVTGPERPDDGRHRVSPLRPIWFPKPLIAAINGPAAGVGFVQALLADVRFASENATFVTVFAGRGLVAEHASAWLLTQIAGRGVALDLLLSSRRVPAAEAERLGLVSRVVPADDLLDEAVAYASGLAADSSPASIRAIKHQVTTQSTMTLAQAERATRRLIDESMSGPDFAEGLTSFLERRPARFAPLGSGTAFTLDRPDEDELWESARGLVI